MTKAYISTIITALIVLCMAVSAWAGDVTLSWDEPAQNEDGTPLTDLAGYNAYYGTASGSYDNQTNVGNKTTHTVTGLTEGQTYYFAVTAYDTSGNESGYSNEVSTLIRADDTPSAPLNTACTQNITINNNTWIGVEPPECK